MLGPDSKDRVTKLVFELSKLPGIGEKTATRLAYYILKQKQEFSDALAEAIVGAKKHIRLCSSCFNFTEQDPCRICQDVRRNIHLICAVERPSDVGTIEQTGVYRGLYHVLHGALSPLDGIGPDDIKIQELIKRLRDVEEVILALNPSVEGDATTLYLSKLLQPLKIKITQLAHGIPVGGQLEYSDRQTISRAIEKRVEMH